MFSLSMIKIMVIYQFYKFSLTLKLRKLEETLEIPAHCPITKNGIYLLQRRR